MAYLNSCKIFALVEDGEMFLCFSRYLPFFAVDVTWNWR